MLRISRKALKIKRKNGKNFKNAAGILSYMGWIKYSDSHALYRKRIEPNVDIKRMKDIVRNYNKITILL